MGLKKHKEHLARRAADEDPIHEEFRKAQNEYSTAIWRTKEGHWTEWLETLDEEGIWTANKLVSGLATDGGRSRIPTLLVKDPVTKRTTKEAWTNTEKGWLLYQSFFPKRTAPLIVPTIYDFVQAKWEYTPTTDKQIHRAIKRMKPWKATWSGTIPNAVFIHARDILVPVLGPIFRATDSLKIYPEDWKSTKMPILSKTKDDLWGRHVSGTSDV